MATPYLTVDVDKIEHNAHVISDLCRQHGIEVSGVTKATCGHPEVARAMLRGRVASIADSRLLNIQRMKAAGIKSRFMLLRVPALSDTAKVVELAQISLNSELSVLQAMSRIASQAKTLHEVMVMVDLGDLREGVLINDLYGFIGDVIQLPGVRLKGIGTNLACFAGVMPSKENMQQLINAAEAVQSEWNLTLDWISAINSSGLELLVSGKMPTRINHARIGEAILLGRETTKRRPWPDTYQDAFVMHAEIIELKHKPSLPIGHCGEDAFGQHAVFEDKGPMLRALLNVGREDVDIHGIECTDPQCSIIGGTSGYLVVDASQSEQKLSVGDELVFLPNYSALLALMTSEYVEKRVIHGL